MTLIKSISGIRGTLGGTVGNSLTPQDIVKFTAAFGYLAKNSIHASKSNFNFVVGRDARISGNMVRDLVCGTLVAMGIDVIDLGLSTTPTVEMAVHFENALGGIIITASHNPKEWNALKLLNHLGEFISEAEGLKVLELADSATFSYSKVDEIGKVSYKDNYAHRHIQSILNLPLVDKKAIQEAHFTIVLDAVNSGGGVFVPQLLEALGVKQIHKINCIPDGHFTHNPEPLPNHLTDLSKNVVLQKANLGIAVDPDVDRLVFINEDGSAFGEEYTLVAVSDYVLKHKKGNTVSNLSSTRALQDITEMHGGKYEASSVGEVNVVQKMKDVKAVIGGEGNGGVIYPELHYGRDALVGIALFLSHLAQSKLKISELRKTYPNYFLSKNKVDLPEGFDLDLLLSRMKRKYRGQPMIDSDGLRIDFDKQWVHLRKSNTEPIIRVYAESSTEAFAQTLADQILADIHVMMKPDA